MFTDLRLPFAAVHAAAGACGSAGLSHVMQCVFETCVALYNAADRVSQQMQIIRF